MRQFLERINKLFRLQNPYSMSAMTAMGVFWGLSSYDENLWMIGVFVLFPAGIIPFLLGVFTSYSFSGLLYIVAEHTALKEQKLELLCGFPVKLVFSVTAALVFFRYFRNFLKNNQMEEKRDFIFYDPTNIRLKLFAVCKHGVVPLFFASLLLSGIGMLIGGSHFPAYKVPFTEDYENMAPVEVEQSALDPAPEEIEEKEGLNNEKGGLKTTVAQDSSKKFFAFYMHASNKSRLHLMENIENMDIVVPDWYSLNSDGTVLESVQTEIDEMLKKNSIKIMPSIHNYMNEKWDPEAVHKLLTTDSARKRLVYQLCAEAKNKGYWGINVNFMDLYQEDRDNLTSFIKELSDAFHSEGLYVTQNVLVKNLAYDSETLADSLDYVLFVISEEHGISTEAGPVASFGWSKELIEKVKTPPEKTVISFSGYGYDWDKNSIDNTVQLAYSEVINFAERHDLQVNWDPASRNPFVAYKENKKEHIIWFLDSSVFYNGLKMSFEKGIAGIALLQLGTEDPYIWKLTEDIGNIEDKISLLEESSSNIQKIVSVDNNGFVDYVNFNFKPRNYKWDEMLEALEKPKDSLDKTNRFFAFYTSTGENDRRSLEKNIESIDVVIPNWYSLEEGGNLMIEKEPGVDDVVRENGKDIMPMVHNYIGGEWNGEAVHNLISDSERRTKFIEQLYEDIISNGYIGINFDFENVKEEDRELWTAFIIEVRDKFSSSGLMITQDVAVYDKAFDYQALSEYEDYFFYMLYDEHNISTMPSSIASAEWVCTLLDGMETPAEQTIVCIGNYGYDWSESAEHASKTLRFDEAMAFAISHGISIKWDTVSCNPYYQYEEDGTKHEVWFLDGATFYNTVIMAAAKGTAGIALWRVGSEDPSLWHVVNSLEQGDSVKKLENIPVPDHYVIEEDDIIKELISGKEVKREIKTTELKFIYDVEYTVPISNQLKMQGDEAMPVIAPHISFIQTSVSSGISLYAFTFRVFRFIWPIAVMLGALRFIFFIIFSLRHKRKHGKLVFDDTYCPGVSVLIAAYNEEVVICNTLAHLLRSSYENFEIIVVDDGSTDDTYKVIRKAFGKEKRVKLLRQENKGKIAAVNYALENAAGDIVITVDADTLVTKDSIKLLIRHFQDPKVAAVAGNIKVTNLNKTAAVFQHIEYLYSFNLERRAFSSVNANIVVPGCNGAWRKSCLMEAGMFTVDTIAEDTDVPIAFLEKGYKVIYEEKALAYTEVPDTLKDLFKQRVRWYFGIMQVLWKNKKLLVKARNKCVRFLTLTNAWIYGILYQLFVPVVDVMILLQLFNGTGRQFVFMYFLLMLADFGLTILAFRMEKESLKPLLWYVPMKIFYRYFMFLMIILSCINAFKGKPLNWNKLKRLGAINAKASI